MENENKKIIQGMVVLSELSNLFVNISICYALLMRNLFNDMMHAKWMCHASTQGIRTIKTFIKYKKCYFQKVQKHKGAVSNVSSLWQNKTY